MNWEITITKAGNGFILSHEEETEYNTFTTLKEVIEETSSEKETMKTLLYKIAEFFGMNYDKYAKDNLLITFDKKGGKATEEKNTKQNENI